MASSRTPTASRSNAATVQHASSTAGGFFRASLPSPAPSTASSRAAARLPRPRSKPLLPGSRKEDYARDYISQRMMHISRRWVKKHGIPDPADQVSGYESMDEVCTDMEEVVDVLWFSGTPSIQIPTLLALALALTEYLPSFPPAPRPTFGLLQKLDHCFASLLVGRDVKTNEPLPGFQRGLGAGFSRTDMVRIKSLADETRMLVAVVMSGEADVDDFEEEVEGDDPAAAAASSRRVGGRDVPSSTLHAATNGDDDDDDLEIIESTSPITTSIKPEQIDDADSFSSTSGAEDEEDEGQEFIDVEPPTNKRKLAQRQQQEGSTDSSHTPSGADALDQHLADEARKRIKMEEEEDGSSVGAGMPPAAASPRYGTTARDSAPASERDGGGGGNIVVMKDEDEPMSGGGMHVIDGGVESKSGAPAASDHQFHWTVEDSDSDSDGDGRTSPRPGQQRQEQQQPQSGPLASQAQTRAQREVDEIDNEDDEEEELHMNVAKVYEKTLTQLGETLGESIIDDQ